jgi:ribonuclease Y
MTLPTLFLVLLVVVAVGLLGDYVGRRLAWKRLEGQARSRARRITAEAENEASTLRQEADLSARELAARLESEAAEKEEARQREWETAESDLRDRRARLEDEENRAQAEQRRAQTQQAEMDRQRQQIATQRDETQELLEETRKKLEEAAGLSREEALERLRSELIAEARAQARDEIHRVLEETRGEMDDKIKELISRSLQRVRVGGFVESTVSLIRLPSDDMKGRIIGREGRNIRSIEMTTGIDLIVDDTPGTILISCHDPLRREIARIAIERLVEDGRIHPGRIEELVEKTRGEMEAILQDTGEAVAYELGIQDLNPRLISLLGQIKYHTTQGQNLLQHSRETADLAGMMALELGLAPEIPRRAGLLHEVAQAAEDRPTSPSILASGEIVVRHGESREVQQAIASAHPDVTPRNVEGALVRLACRLSRSRIGARKHNLEIFINRLRRLEGLATSYPGVRSAHVFRAGKDLRVLVESDKLSDQETVALSREIADRLRREVDLPGEVRVSVLRETRAIDFAL